MGGLARHAGALHLFRRVHIYQPARLVRGCNLEAMAHRLPIITLAHQGAGAFVPDNAGIKATVESPERCVQSLAQAIATVYRHPEKRVDWGTAGERFARTQNWTVRAEQMLDWYERLADGRWETPIAAAPNFGSPSTSTERA